MQATVVEIEIPAVALQAAGRDRIADEGEAHQVLKRYPDRRLLTGHVTRFGVRMLSGQCHAACLLGDQHPRLDELTGAVAELDIAQQGADTAAMCMTHNDDMLYVQTADRELERGTGAMVTAACFAGRHEIRDVAHDKHVARIAVHDDRRIDP